MKDEKKRSKRIDPNDGIKHTFWTNVWYILIINTDVNLLTKTNPNWTFNSPHQSKTLYPKSFWSNVLCKRWMLFFYSFGSSFSLSIFSLFFEFFFSFFQTFLFVFILSRCFSIQSVFIPLPSVRINKYVYRNVCIHTVPFWELLLQLKFDAGKFEKLKIFCKSWLHF